MPLYRLTPPGEIVEADSVRDEWSGGSVRQWDWTFGVELERPSVRRPAVEE